MWGLSLTFAAAAQSSTDVSCENLGEEHNRSTTGNESSFDSQLQLDSESTKLDRSQDLDIIRDIDGSTASLWTNIFLLVALPIVTIIILSIKLYAVARKHAAQIEAQQRQFTNFKKDYKAAVTFFIVAGCFALAWLPNFVLSLYLAYKNDISSVSPYLNYFVRLFMYCNSWWNVCIYYLRNRSFRSEARSMFPRMRREPNANGNYSNDVNAIPTISSRQPTSDNLS